MNVKARASYWGWVGAQADIAHTREELLASGAIRIEQISAPEELNNERIKQLEASIIDSWAKNILAQIAQKPQMNPAEAPNPKGFFGGVSVSLKSYEQVQHINLSAEYNYSQLTEERYSLSYVFGLLLAQGSPAEHLLDVTEDNKLPIVINLCKHELVYRYSGQFGYRKSDGTFIANAITDVNGKEGGVLTGVIQFATTEPMPEKTEVQLSVDWENPDWEDRVEHRTLQNKASGVIDDFSPGNNVAHIKIMTDLERAAENTISIINYRSVLPDYQGTPVKVYSGAIVLLGQGDAGQFKEELLEFPYYKETQLQSKLAWDLTIYRPDGSVVTQSGEIPVNHGGLALLGAVLTRDVVPTPRERGRLLLEALPGLFHIHPITYPVSQERVPMLQSNGETSAVSAPPPPRLYGQPPPSRRMSSSSVESSHYRGDAW